MNELREQGDTFLLRFIFLELKLGFDFLQDNNLVGWGGETDAEERWERGTKGRITRNA